VDDAVSLLAAIVTYCFAAAVFDQFLHRRRAYQLIWCLSLAAFAISFTAQFAASVTEWTALLFRLWYGFGALYAVPLLGLGSIYLLCPRWAKIAGTVIGVELMVWGFLRIYGQPLDAINLIPAPGATHPNTQLLPPDIRSTAVLLNSLGTLVLFAGAAWSAWSFRRRRTAPHRVVSNVLIAAGAVIAGSAGGLEKFGYPSLLYLGNMAGITVIFAGFLRSNERMDAAHLPVLRHLRGSRQPAAGSREEVGRWEQEAGSGRRRRDASPGGPAVASRGDAGLDRRKAAGTRRPGGAAGQGKRRLEDGAAAKKPRAVR
jgi:hypothetical protein